MPEPFAYNADQTYAKVAPSRSSRMSGAQPKVPVGTILQAAKEYKKEKGGICKLDLADQLGISKQLLHITIVRGLKRGLVTREEYNELFADNSQKPVYVRLKLDLALRSQLEGAVKTNRESMSGLVSKILAAHFKQQDEQIKNQKGSVVDLTEDVE